MAELVREARAVNERLRALAVLNAAGAAGAADSAGKDNDEAAAAPADTDGIASTCAWSGQGAPERRRAWVAALYDSACIAR